MTGMIPSMAELAVILNLAQWVLFIALVILIIADVRKWTSRLTHYRLAFGWGSIAALVNILLGDWIGIVLCLIVLATAVWGWHREDVKLQRQQAGQAEAEQTEAEQ